MISTGTFLNVCDKTGVVLVQCVKILGPTHKKTAYIGDIILVSVKHMNPKRFVSKKLKKKKDFFSKGTLHRALIVRAKTNFKRTEGVFIRFSENAVVLVNKKVIPISNRAYGPVLKELCMRIPALGCIAMLII